MKIFMVNLSNQNFIKNQLRYGFLIGKKKRIFFSEEFMLRLCFDIKSTSSIFAILF